MMKRKMAVALAVFAIGVAPLSLLAQMAPPGPLEDDLYNWMAGKWEGATESSMGKFTDEMEVDWDLGHQFVNIHYKSKTAETDPAKLEEMAKAMGMTKEQMQTPYKGVGYLTIDPQTKEYIGYWFGSMRDVSVGKGTREGNKITMTWEGPMGSEMRTFEKAGEDKLVMAFEGKDPQGNVIKGTTTMMRKAKKAKADKKS
jgi:hypothetical protein